MVEILSPKIPPVEHRHSQGRERVEEDVWPERPKRIPTAAVPMCASLPWREAEGAAFRQGVHLQSRISGASIRWRCE